MGVARARNGISQTPSQIDNQLTTMIDRNGRSDFLTLVEVAEEALSDCREFRFDVANYSGR